VPLPHVTPHVTRPVLAAVKPQAMVIPAPPGARITGVAGVAKLAAVPSAPALHVAAAPSAPVAAPASVSPAPVSSPASVSSAAPAPLDAPARKPGAGKKPRPKSVSLVKPIAIRPVAALARIRPRHRLLAASFALIVLLPILIAAAYLWGKAADQYASTVGFSVRREEGGAPLDMLGGLASISQSGSSDSDILYEYLRSQKLVADMDAKLNLRSIWSDPVSDPVFAFDSTGSIEDLLDYWQRMVRTSYDGATGLIEVRVLAFDPDNATVIAQNILDESARMINDLSTAAREDAVRYAREDLSVAQDRLRTAREAITAFRVKNQIVDPTTDFQTQAGLVSRLENELAQAQIEIDLLADAPAGDPRLVQAKRRLEVIETRIAAERRKVGEDSALSTGKDYAALASEYERLAVDREFAEQAYVAALATYDAARAESQRTSRYLAAHVMPTKAEVSRFPERLWILGLLALGLILLWSITALVAYSLKDRR
jgi:capsular polysaccharide transport system permease protein